VILSLLKVDDWIVVDVRFGMSLNLQVQPPGASVTFSAYAAHFPVTSMAQKKGNRSFDRFPFLKKRVNYCATKRMVQYEPPDSSP
jgi:hypothetical protein